MGDSLSNLLANLKAASVAKLPLVKVLNTKLNLRVLIILFSLGFIRGYTIENSKSLFVQLKYSSLSASAIKQIQRVSKPGGRVYVSLSALKQLIKTTTWSPTSVAVLSTPHGLLTHSAALQLQVGGEVLFIVS